MMMGSLKATMGAPLFVARRQSVPSPDCVANRLPSGLQLKPQGSTQRPWKQKPCMTKISPCGAPATTKASLQPGAAASLAQK